MSSPPADATEIAALVRAGELSAVEAVEATLARIEAVDGEIGAFLTVDAEGALAAAAAADRTPPAGPLHGVPLAVKDLEWTRGLRTTMGSRAFADFVPEEDAISVARLRAAGAIVIGKTNTPELGLIGETRNELAPETRNPWDTGRTVGGSSGGSAAAVAAGMVPAATGNDTAGSITCPAAMCGLVGVKPTHGRVPNWPDPGDSRLFLDSGPLTRTVADAALLLSVMSGPDERDPVSLAWPGPVGAVAGGVATPDSPRERRVAWSADFGRFDVDGEVASIAGAAAAAFEELGYRVEEAHPDLGDPFAISLPLIAADGLAAIEALGIGPEQLSADSRAELEDLGAPTAAEYARALNALWRYRAGMEAFFARYALVLTPSTAVPAFPLGCPPTRWTGFMPFQTPWNLTGQPTATLPCGRTAGGLPVGLQVTAPRGADERLLAACAAYEEMHRWSIPSLPAAEAPA